MPTHTAREQEALDAYRGYVGHRTRCEAGEADWAALADWFTEDAVFIDPAWGRMQGRDEMGDFFRSSMVGLETWSFPEQWTMVDGDRLVSFWWNRLPDSADGSVNQAPAVSILHYAGDGRFDYELDILNMAEVMEVVGRAPWEPGEGFQMPPSSPDRRPTPPRLPTP